MSLPRYHPFLLSLTGTSAYNLVRPKISLSGATFDGTPVTTQLLLTDASFVHGLFASVSAYPAFLNVSDSQWLSEANRILGLPLGLLMVSIWSLLLLAIAAWENYVRMKVRLEDKQRMSVNVKQGWVVEDVDSMENIAA